MNQYHETPMPASALLITDPRRCACGGRLDLRVVLSGHVEQTCERCGAWSSMCRTLPGACPDVAAGGVCKTPGCGAPSRTPASDYCVACSTKSARRARAAARPASHPCGTPGCTVQLEGVKEFCVDCQRERDRASKRAWRRRQQEARDAARATGRAA